MDTPSLTEKPSTFRFLIVDDHPVTRAGTRALLEQTYPNCLCQEASSLSEMAPLLRESSWDLIVLDYNLPDGRGLDILKSLKHPPPTLILTMFEEPGMKMSALKAGAKGFVSKSSAPKQILSAIESVLRGDCSFVESGDRQVFPKLHLSNREESILKRMLDGSRLTDIASEFGVAPTTIQSYKKRLFEKFDVTTNAELLKAAFHRGMIERK